MAPAAATQRVRPWTAAGSGSSRKGGAAGFAGRVDQVSLSGSIPGKVSSWGRAEVGKSIGSFAVFKAEGSVNPSRVELLSPPAELAPRRTASNARVDRSPRLTLAEFRAPGTA